MADVIVAEIGSGLLVFLGVVSGDTKETAEWMARKTLSIRIFADERQAMNRSITDVGGSLLVVSQFTLAAEITRGNRPNFGLAASPVDAKLLYDHYVSTLRAGTHRVETGSFGSDMRVVLENDGPVTIFLDHE